MVEVIDPVEVINKGTCFDGNKNIKRQNYAFYEGYSRINWEVEKPDYSGKRSGTGVMFRVSENIELYGAKLGIESAAFDTAPFLTGKQGTRIILKSDDSLLSRITGDSSGCWLKGIPETGKERFEIGITPIRLTIKELSIDPVKTAIPFSLTNEEKRRGDIEGEIIDDGERSILKVYALSNNGTKTDTLKNISEPGILLHRQKRVLEYNKDFMMGDKLDFQVVTKPEDSGKVFVDKSQISGYRAVLVDTSVTSGGWTGLVYEFLGSQLIRCVGVEGETRRLGMVDAEDGVCEVWCDGIVGIAMETDDKKWLLEKDRKKVEIKLRSKGNVVIYSARNKSKQLFPIPPGLIKFKKDGDAYVIKWQDYEDHFLKNDSIYATVDQGEYGEFEIVAQYKSTNQEHTKEKAIILGVPKIESIEILSDHMDDEGKNLLRFEPNSFYGIGKQIIGPEWYYDGTTIPTSHTRSTYLRLRIKIIVPLNGQYEVEGLSADTFLSFSKKVFLLKTGLNEFDIQGDNLLPNFPHKIESETEWIIASKMYNGKKQIIKKIISNFILYLTYNKPLTVNSGNYKTNITSKRMDLATLMLAGVTDTTVAASAVRDLLDIRLQNFFRQPVLKNNELWRIWDYEELYPIPFIPPKEMRGVQCGQGALMAELILGILGLYAEYTHLQPSKEYIRFSSLSNPDDSLICNRPPHTSCQVDHLHEEILLYYFSGFINPWQKGEGAIYYNNTIYTMFTNGVDGFGSSKKAACRNAMENLEAKNTDIIKNYRGGSCCIKMVRDKIVS